MSPLDKCPNCWHGNIVKRVCDGCGNQFGTIQSALQTKKKKTVREKLPNRDDRKKMVKALEPLGFDPYNTSIKGGTNDSGRY